MAVVSLSALGQADDIKLTGKPYIDMNYGPYMSASIEVGQRVLVRRASAPHIEEETTIASIGLLFGSSIAVGISRGIGGGIRLGSCGYLPLGGRLLTCITDRHIPGGGIVGHRCIISSTSIG